MREPFVPTFADSINDRLKRNDTLRRLQDGPAHLLPVASLEGVELTGRLKQHCLHRDRSLCPVVKPCNRHLRQFETAVRCQAKEGGAAWRIAGSARSNPFASSRYVLPTRTWRLRTSRTCLRLGLSKTPPPMLPARSAAACVLYSDTLSCPQTVFSERSPACGALMRAPRRSRIRGNARMKISASRLFGDRPLQLRILLIVPNLRERTAL